MFKTKQSKEMPKSMQDKFDAITEAKFERAYCDVMITNNYGKFSNIIGNRTVNPVHAKNIKESIAVKQIAVPIVVNENFQICDGQNRFKACVDLKKPIYYIKIDGLTLEDVQRLNANTHTWDTDDFLDSFCELGFKEYKKYREYRDKYKFGHTECMIILNGWKNKGKSLHQNFRDGNLTIQNYSEAKKISDMIVKVGDYYQGYKRAGFVKAMLQLFKTKEYDHDKFLGKLSKQSAKMTDQSTKKLYLERIEEIYNFGSQNKVRLFPL